MLRVAHILLFFLFVSIGAQSQYQEVIVRQPRNPSFGVGLNIMFPSRVFSQNFDGIPTGFAGQFLIPSRVAPFEFGAGLAWHSMGTESDDVYILEGTDVQGNNVYSEGDISVKSNIYSYDGIFRFKPLKGPIRPYGDLIAGIRSFSTKSEIQSSDSPSSEAIKNVPHRNISYKYGWAVGLRVNVAPQLFVEGRMERFFGSRTKFVDRESLIIDDLGELEYQLLESETDSWNMQLGVSFEF